MFDGFVLSAFGDEIDLNFETQLAVLEQHGIRYLEIRGVNGKGIVEYSLPEVKKISRRLQAGGFGVSAVGSPLGKINITGDFAPHLDLFRHTLEIAGVLGTGYIRMFSFFLPPGDDPGRYRDEVMERWRRFLEAAAGSGLVLLHENEKEIYGDTPERCLDLLTALHSPFLKATFDPANFIQCGVEVYPHAYRLLKEHIAYVHIKDALLRDGRVVPAGQGDGKIKELLSALSHSGYSGFLSLEPHLGNFQGLTALEPGVSFHRLPESGPEQFAVAFQALQKIISELMTEGGRR